MFNVTLVNLTADARTADVELGVSKRGNFTALELAALLETFRELDPVQNISDPEIRVQTARESYFIRTEQKKLFLYNSRNREDPAYVLTVAEIIAELDGTAAAARTAVPFAMTSGLGDRLLSEEVALREPKPVSRRRTAAKIAATCLLGATIIYLKTPWDQGDEQPALSRLEPTELAAYQLSLPGVYMTGNQPGQHGLVVMANGGLKIFQLNSQAAPSVLQANYSLGQLGTKLHLQTNQPGGLIQAADRNTLIYCNEVYIRIR